MVTLVHRRISNILKQVEEELSTSFRARVRDSVALHLEQVLQLQHVLTDSLSNISTAAPLALCLGSYF